MFKRIFALLLCAALLACPLKTKAQDLEAAELTAACDVTADGASATLLTDNNIYTYRNVGEIKIKSETPLYGLYVKFDRTPKPWCLTADGVDSTWGEKGFLHEFVPLNGETELVLSFEGNASVADVFVYGEGELPDTVQRWELLEKADVMICPTHSDDDQLYFAGMIPWCTAMGYDVQIVYLTNHWNTHDRPHELLDGLWHCGLTYYPYIAEHPDLYAMSAAEAEAAFANVGINKSDFTEFYVELFQRYNPLVVAGHDINGEYGHGVHRLNSAAIMEAVVLSAERGLWDVPKTYIHLWQDNAVTFNWDLPMEELGGKTPFEISQEGYGFHHSQHRFEGLWRWIYGTEAAPITKASQIYSYNPCKYGLFRSTVGYDTEENGLFQNLETHRQQAAQQKPPEEPPQAPSEEPKYELDVVLSGEARKQTYKAQSDAAMLLKKPIVLVNKSTEETESFEESTSVDNIKTKENKNNRTALVIAALSVMIAILAVAVKRKRTNEGNDKNKA